MPISGSQPAYSHAQGGVMRGASSRGNVHSKQVFVKIAGVHYATGRDVAGRQVDEGTLSIQEVDGETPNTCTFQVRGFTPSDGQEVIITQGSKNNLDREFAGRILNDTSGYVGIPTNTRDQVNVIDYTWELTRETITQRWTNVSASTIAAEIIADAGRGLTARVEAGLATIDEFTVTNERHIAALRRLADRGGWKVKVTYRKEVLFGTTQGTETNPTTLTSASMLATQTEQFKIARDLGPVVTKQPGEGGGSKALTEVAVGETILPVEDTAWYSETGGTVVSGPQRLTYTAIAEGGGGTLVGPGASPSAPPAATLAVGTGMEAGTHDYAATFVTASGESLPSPRVQITAGTLPAPAAAPTPGAPTLGGSVTAGTHQYAVTFITAAGETTPSALSTVVTTGGVAVGSPPAAPQNNGQSSGGNLTAQGTYKWAITWVTATGETTPGPELTVTLPSGGWKTQGLGNFPANGDTTNPAPPQATSFNLYRTVAGGSQLKLVTNLPLSTLSYQDSLADASLGANAPTSNANTANTVPLTSIPTGITGVTDRKLYRTAAGGSQLKLLATIANNTATTYTDTIADGSLGANAPTTNTATAAQVALSSIPIGGTGTTQRKIYRTAANGSQLKLLTTIANNTATTWTDNAGDASLGANAPTGDTSGLTQPTGSVVAGSDTIVVAGPGAFDPLYGGWAIIGNGQQVIRYFGFNATIGALTNIPATGPGSITATISYNTTITAAPALLHVPAAGIGSILYPIKKGDPVNVRVVVDDFSAQATIAALLGGSDDGIIEGSLIQDGRLSETEIRARCQAQLDLRKAIDVGVTYVGHDINSHAGRTVAANVTAPSALNTSFRIRSVTISNFHPQRWQTHQVNASSRRFTLEDLLRLTRAVTGLGGTA
jgi:hypothetical protein